MTEFRKKMQTAFNRARGIPLETDLADYWRTVREIRHFVEAEGLDRRTDGEIRELAAGLAPGSGEGPDAVRAAVEAFALVFEAARRTIGLAAHDVQLVAGLAMLGGKVAELPTGEGKTLAAVFPASVLALAGRGVHVLTFNDYLARRDAAWMGPAYRLLGLSVGVVQEGMGPAEKAAAYACDVTYATAKEAGFDFLRDQLAFDPRAIVHRRFQAALVDEADSILVDEARIPLVIAGVAGKSDSPARALPAVVRRLAPGRDYETDHEKGSVFLTDRGLASVERALGCGNLYSGENERLLAAVHCALHAEALLHRDVDYIVRNGRIEIVDEFTGRVMDRRHWPDGLQAAVEAKEGLDAGTEGRILGSITLQHFFRLYPRLCGMTATAVSSVRELGEFYGLGVVVVPPHKPCVRVDRPDLVFTHREAKFRALVSEILGVQASGRPVLVGTSSVRDSEELAARLVEAGVPCKVLNAKNDELEAGIIAGAGRPGAVTISTNMAGRGTDIKLGGEREEERARVAALGGLYVIGTNRHESLRIDRQLRGRSGRQGDPGSSRFFISLDDDIFESYGLRDKLFSRYRLEKSDGAIDLAALRRDIVHAQRVIEGRNLDVRKTLRDYSSLVEDQRKIVQRWRAEILGSDDGPGPVPFIPGRTARVTKAGSARFGGREFAGLARGVALFHIDKAWSAHLARVEDLRESIHLVSLGGKEPLQEFRREVTEAFLALENKIGRSVRDSLKSLVEREGPVDLDAEGLKGPSSTWTYLVNDEQFGWGVGLLKGKNIGFAAGAAAFYGPLFLFTLVARRWRDRKKGRRKAGDEPDGKSRGRA